MSRRDVLASAPCGDDCAEESYPYRVRSRPKRRTIVWKFVWWTAVFWFVMLALGTALSSIFVRSCDAQTPDSGAVILAVANYWPDSANIFVQADSGFQSIGHFAPGSRSWIVLPSTTLGHAALLRVIAAPIISHHVLFEMEPIVRNTNGQPTAKTIQVGDPPTSKPGSQS